MSACDVITKRLGLCSSTVKALTDVWADADIKRSAKAGLDALFLLLHFFFFLKKDPCKYFSVLQKQFVQFYWEGKFC